jgi:hypothetical protein
MPKVRQMLEIFASPFRKTKSYRSVKKSDAVAHPLNVAIESTYPQKRLVTLRSVKHRGLTHFLIGHESWFWFTIDLQTAVASSPY